MLTRACIAHLIIHTQFVFSVQGSLDFKENIMDPYPSICDVPDKSNYMKKPKDNLEKSKNRELHFDKVKAITRNILYIVNLIDSLKVKCTIFFI